MIYIYIFFSGCLSEDQIKFTFLQNFKVEDYRNYCVHGLKRGWRQAGPAADLDQYRKLENVNSYELQGISKIMKRALNSREAMNRLLFCKP